MSPTPPRTDMSDLAPSLQQEVARLAAAPEVRSAFNWFRTQETQLTHWQMEMARIPAPPFGESARGAWLAERFREVGLDDVRIDDVGNVFGIHPGFGRRYVALSAHIDTVFPANTPLNIRQQGSRIYGPGVSDNGAGVAAMLAIAALLRSVRLRHSLPFDFDERDGAAGACAATGTESSRGRRDHDGRDAFAGTKTTGRSKLRSGGDRQPARRRVAAWGSNSASGARGRWATVERGASAAG